MSKVDDLDASMVLAAAAATEREARMVELRRLELAVQWCVLHPATAETGVATHNPDTTLPGVLGLDESLGGDGTPAVAAFTPEPFAAAMEMSPAAGARLLADALDLTHRLPMLWSRVQALTIPAWQARRAAQHTHQLSLEAARWVDDRLADRTGCGPIPWTGWSPTRSRGSTPRNTRDARTRARRPGTSNWSTPPDRVRRHQRAACPRRHPGPDQVLRPGLRHRHQHRPRANRRARCRKAKAWRVLADLALTARPPAGPWLTSPRRRREGSAAALHVRRHSDLTRLAAVTSNGSARPRSPRSRTGWATPRSPSNPSSTSDAATPSTQHDPPAWMREIVILRDRHCVFPGCRVDARACDQDHIDPYLDPGDGGPPGQTSPANLACLCRRHHRAKTAGTLAIPTRPQPRRLPLARPPRGGVPRHPHRHHHPAHQLSAGRARRLQPPRRPRTSGRHGRRGPPRRQPAASRGGIEPGVAEQAAIAHLDGPIETAGQAERRLAVRRVDGGAGCRRAAVQASRACGECRGPLPRHGRREDPGPSLAVPDIPGAAVLVGDVLDLVCQLRSLPRSRTPPRRAPPRPRRSAPLHPRRPGPPGRRTAPSSRPATWCPRPSRAVPVVGARRSAIRTRQQT